MVFAVFCLRFGKVLIGFLESSQGSHILKAVWLSRPCPVFLLWLGGVTSNLNSYLLL